MRFKLWSAVLLPALLLGAGQPSKIFNLPYQQHDFPNGLRLITVRTDYPNVVALYIVVQVGARNEVEPGKTGFAHFFEHMMFRGTEQVPPDKWTAIMRDAGAQSNAFTSDDLTAYHETFSKEDLEIMLRIEADRFQNLKYSLADFRTEALAVLGEYNKNAASPVRKLYEVLRNTAFDRHTYKHTPMGFLEDIKDMPNEFDYSRIFFDRFYRPEYTTILVVGDIDHQQTRTLVEKYWGGWQRGSHKAEIPMEPPQKEPRRTKVDWPVRTLPWVWIASKSSAFTDTDIDSAALDLLGFLGFSESSELYQRLVIQEQKVDALIWDNSDHVDPYLFTVGARVKKPEDMKVVEEQILDTMNGFKDTLVPAAKLEAAKKHLRYRFALSLDNSEAIAQTLTHFIALRRTPETINRLYEIYARLTPEDLRRVARKYFVESGRTTVTLEGPVQ
jgi:zinc protease